MSWTKHRLEDSASGPEREWWRLACNSAVKPLLHPSLHSPYIPIKPTSLLDHQGIRWGHIDLQFSDFWHVIGNLHARNFVFGDHKVVAEKWYFQACKWQITCWKYVNFGLLSFSKLITSIMACIFMPSFEKGGAYCFAHVGRSVSMPVSLNLVQLITQEGFAHQPSNLVGR